VNTEPTSSSGLDKLAGHLTEFAGAVVPTLRRYEGNQLREELTLTVAGSSDASFAEVDWKSTLRVEPVSYREATFDIEWTVKSFAGFAESVGVGLGFSFAAWSPRNYVLLPAAVYAGNNFEIAKMKYPPLWREPGQFREDMPTTTTDLPRLSANSPRLEQTTGDVSTPGMGFFSPERQQGFLLLTTQATNLGKSGLTVETFADGGHCRLLVTAPRVREFRQDLCKAVPSDDSAARWEAGDSVTLRVRVCFFAAPELQSLFDRFVKMRKDLNPSERREELPFSAAWKIVEEKYNRDNWVEQHGYYKLAPTNDTTYEAADNPICFLWQLGWVGGGMMTLPMLAQGGPLTRARARSNLKMIFEKTQAHSGFFYGSGDGENFYSDSFDRPHPHNLHLVRKSADWLYFAIKQLDLLRKQGEAIPPDWETRIKHLADAFVRLWEQHEQFGQFLDVETGRLLIGGSACGAIIPAGLTLAANYFSEPGYFTIASAAAKKYYHEFVCQGITTGGPGEILSAPDSESAFALLESFVTLLEATGEPFWGRAAREVTRQAATWVVAYDYVFPPKSALGRSGARTTGAVWANVQNKHGAPGICTFSGDALLRLWRATDDTLALDLIRDIAHGIPQYLSRADRPLTKMMRPGWMCERVNLSDWEGAQGVGGQLFGSCGWVETSLMLTTWEIPGLYVQPDSGFFCVFDHVTAERISHVDGSLKLRLTNPTKFDAEVKVLCEASTRCRQPLGLNVLFGAPIVHIAAGESRVETFSVESGSPHRFRATPNQKLHHE
jgi:hypothetical protein